MNRSQTQLAAALVVAWLGGISAAQAASPTTLQDLINGASIRVFDPVNPGAPNDLTFSNFQNVVEIGTLSVPFNQIFVSPIWGGVGGLQNEPGLRFQSAYWSLTGPGQTYDLSFEFLVSHTLGSAVLTDNTLALTGATLGSGIAQVAEGVVNPLNSQTVANKYVFTDAFGEQLVDHDVFPGGPYSSLQIRKDFVMSSGSAQGARVFVSDFDQTFSSVPETSPGLAGVGLALLAGRQVLRRRMTPVAGAVAS